MTDSRKPGILVKIFSPYLLFYVFFFRINKGKWPDYLEMDHLKGVFGATVFAGVFCVEISHFFIDAFEIDIFIDKQTVVIASGFLFFLGYYILITRKVGIYFENRYECMDVRDKAFMFSWLFVCCLFIVIANILYEFT